MTSEDIKHQLIIIIYTAIPVFVAANRMVLVLIIMSPAMAEIKDGRMIVNFLDYAIRYDAPDYRKD